MSEANQIHKKQQQKAFVPLYPILSLCLQKRSEKVNPSPLPSSDAYELYAIPV